MKPGSGGVPPTPAGAKLGECGTMMDTFENMCIPHDGLARYPTNSTAECCERCLAKRSCFSCESVIFRSLAQVARQAHMPAMLSLQGWCGMMKACAT